MNSYQNLNALIKDKSTLNSREKPNVCIATPDFVDFVRNGGIGTSFYHTAKLLSKNGFTVTILYCNWVNQITPEEISKTKDRLLVDGIRCEVLLENDSPSLVKNFYPADMAITYVTYRWLKNRQADLGLIIFPEWQGIGYYTLMAKRAGLAFKKIPIWVQTHSSSLWHALNDHATEYNEEMLRLFQRERGSVELADIVVSPTNYLLDWKEQHGFIFPNRTFVQPYLIDYPEIHKPSRQCSNINELVFFGRLEKRKGVHHFCASLIKLFRDSGPIIGKKLTVTFLGKIAEVDGEPSIDFISNKLGGLPIKLNILITLDHAEAISYLKKDGRVAIICSVADNSPLTVIECLHHQIPFLASNVGGIPELIDSAHHEDVLFNLHPADLSAAISRILKFGHHSVPPCISQKDNLKIWSDALTASATEAQQVDSHKSNRISKDLSTPELTVCITHFNRPHLLAKTLEGLERQTYRDFEVIIVDDGSTDPVAQNFLDDLSNGKSTSYPCQIIRQQNRFVGAARNKGIRAAKGEYVVIMDDDNYADPRQLELLVTAMRSNYYDAAVCLALAFEANGEPGVKDCVQHLFLPLGNGISANSHANFFGDANAIFKKQILIDIGGFTEDYGLSWEDYEIFMKLAVNGYKLGVVPEPLLWLRSTPNSVSRVGSQVPNYYRALRPLMSKLDWRTIGDAWLLGIGSTISKLSHQFLNQNEFVVKPGEIPHFSYSGITATRLTVNRMVKIGQQLDIDEILLSNSLASKSSSILAFDWLSLEILKNKSIYTVSLNHLSDQKGEPLDLVRTLLGYIKTKDQNQILNALERVSKPCPDHLYIVGRVLAAHGSIFASLGFFAKALNDPELVYLRMSEDVAKAVESNSLRSGIEHYLYYGKSEGRPFDYAPPIANFFASSAHTEINDFRNRIEFALSQSSPDWLILNQILYECLLGNVSFELTHLSRLILSLAEKEYIDMYDDVRVAVQNGRFSTGISHYLSKGIAEGRHCALNNIDKDRLMHTQLNAIDGLILQPERSRASFERLID